MMTNPKRKGAGADTGNAGHFARVERGETSAPESADALEMAEDTLAEIQSELDKVVAEYQKVADRRKAVYQRLEVATEEWADALPDPEPGTFFDRETTKRLVQGSSWMSGHRCTERLDDAARALHPALRYEGAAVKRMDGSHTMPVFTADAESIDPSDEGIAEFVKAYRTASDLDNEPWESQVDPKDQYWSTGLEVRSGMSYISTRFHAITPGTGSVRATGMEYSADGEHETLEGAVKGILDLRKDDLERDARKKAREESGGGIYDYDYDDYDYDDYDYDDDGDY